MFIYLQSHIHLNKRQTHQENVANHLHGTSERKVKHDKLKEFRTRAEFVERKCKAMGSPSTYSRVLKIESYSP